MFWCHMDLVDTNVSLNCWHLQQVHQTPKPRTSLSSPLLKAQTSHFARHIIYVRFLVKAPNNSEKYLKSKSSIYKTKGNNMPLIT